MIMLYDYDGVTYGWTQISPQMCRVQSSGWYLEECVQRESSKALRCVSEKCLGDVKLIWSVVGEIQTLFTFSATGSDWQTAQIASRSHYDSSVFFFVCVLMPFFIPKRSLCIKLTWHHPRKEMTHMTHEDAQNYVYGRGHRGKLQQKI